jgi:hypothetical protein
MYIGYKYKGFPTTIISIYFQLNKSKHSIDEYVTWNKNALSSIQSPIVLFTDQKSKQELSKIRSENITFIVYENVWELMKELEKKRDMKYIEKYLNDQWQKDPEKGIHNPNLYAVWNLKAYICSKVAEENPFKSSFFIYSDLGAWRRGIIENWPDNNFIRILSEKLNDRLIFSQIHSVKDPNEFDINRDSIQAGFFAGSPKALINYSKFYYEIHDKRFNQNLFVGKEQLNMNYVAYKTNDLNLVFLRTWEVYNCNSNKNKLPSNEWFIYQEFFSQLQSFYCNYDKRLSLLSNI